MAYCTLLYLLPAYLSLLNNTSVKYYLFPALAYFFY